MKLKIDVTLNEVKSIIKFLRGFITQCFTQHDVRILFLLLLILNFQLNFNSAVQGVVCE